MFLKLEIADVALQSKNKIVYGSFEVLLSTGDEEDELDFIDTLEKYINMQIKN